MARIFWALFYKAFLAVINLAVGVISGRYLGALGRGFYTNTTNYVSYYSPVVGSFSEYIPYGINKRKHPPQAVFSASLWFCIVLSGILFLTALIGTKWLLHGAFGLNVETTVGLWVAGLLAPFAVFSVYVTRLMWGLNELEWLNRLNTVQAVVFLLLLLVVMFGVHPANQHRTLFVLGAWYFSFVMTSFVSIYAVRKVNIPLKPKRDEAITPEIRGFGSKLLLGNLVAAINSRIDVSLVWTYLGSSHTGVYGVAVTAAEMLGILSSSILQVVLTRVSSMEEKDSSLLTARIFRHTAVVVVFSAILMYFFMPVLLHLYGKDFSASLPDFRILLPGMALYSTAVVLTSFFNNQLGKPQITTALQIVSIAMNVSVSIWLLPKIGEAGSAWAKTVAYSSFFVITVVVFAFVTKYPFLKLFYLQADEVDQYRGLFKKIIKRIKR